MPDLTDQEDGSTTYEEWRVVGKPNGGYPLYDFTWSLRINPQLGDPERGARTFVTRVSGWDEGPSLSRRTVVVGPWQDVALQPDTFGSAGD